MITRLHIENFKSLVDFELPGNGHELGKFVCLVGMNGSGKSTVLQALDFLAQLMTGRISDWLERREWESADLASRIAKVDASSKAVHSQNRGFRPAALILFEIEFEFGGEPVVWRGEFNRFLMRCTQEEIRYAISRRPILVHRDGELRYDYTWRKNELKLWRGETGDLGYEGSILSVYSKIDAPVVRQIRSFMRGLKSLEQLTPQAMRRRSRKGEDIGYGGEKLAVFLDSLPSDSKLELCRILQSFYPSLLEIEVSTLRGGWKKLFSREHIGSPLRVSASHMNDGMLRVIAILAQAYSEHPVLLFDEIENGINPELVERLVDFLVGLKGKQVFVTTHSPMILNYLEDKVARESVHLLYRDGAGWTRSTRFFDIPEVGAKLEALGPGEVFVDTNLTKLTQKLSKRKSPAASRRSA